MVSRLKIVAFFLVCMVALPTFAQAITSVNYTFADGTTITYSGNLTLYKGDNDTLEIDDNDTNVQFQIYYPTTVTQVPLKTAQDVLGFYVGDLDTSKVGTMQIGNLDAVTYDDTFTASNGDTVPRYTLALLTPQGSGLVAATNPLYGGEITNRDLATTILSTLSYTSVPDQIYTNGAGASFSVAPYLEFTDNTQNVLKVSDYGNTLRVNTYFQPTLTRIGAKTATDLLIWYEGADYVDATNITKASVGSFEAVSYDYLYDSGKGTFERKLYATLLPNGVGLVAVLSADFEGKLIAPDVLEGVVQSVQLGERQTYYQEFADGAVLPYAGDWIMSRSSVYRLAIDNDQDGMVVKAMGHINRFDAPTLLAVMQDYLTTTSFDVTLSESDLQDATIMGEQAVRYDMLRTLSDGTTFTQVFYAWQVVSTGNTYVAVMYPVYDGEIVDEQAMVDLLDGITLQNPITVSNYLNDDSQITYNGKWYVQEYSDLRLQLVSDSELINIYLYGGQGTAKKDNTPEKLLESDIGLGKLNVLNLDDITLAGLDGKIYRYSITTESGSEVKLTAVSVFLPNQNAITAYSYSYYGGENTAEDDLLAIIDSLVPSDKTMCSVKPIRNATKLRNDPSLEADFSEQIDNTVVLLSDGYAQVDGNYWYRIFGDHTGWLRGDSVEPVRAGTCANLGEISYP